MSAVLQSMTKSVDVVLPHHSTAAAPEMAHAMIRSGFLAARSSGKRAKDAASSLGISEGSTIAAHVGQHEFALKATPLKGPWVDVLQALEFCGPLMALTRNEGVVHEKTGVYQHITTTGHMGLALGEDIDLRLFFGRWHAGFAVYERANNPASPPNQSLQFFDAHGTAVHKIFVQPDTDRDSFNNIISQFTYTNKLYEFTPPLAKTPIQADAEIDAAHFAQAWERMTDTHQFFGLINKFCVERQQAFRLVEGRFTQRADLGIVRILLEEAAIDGTPIMVFVSSSGCIQIHSGPVKRIEPMLTPTARWINVLDTGFNLHVREDMIANAWIVQKPTEDGIVTSVEIFDTHGDLMAMFFGSRKPGIPEQQAWRDIAARLPRLEAA